ncbi:OmpW family outer membrane protein [Halomonas sp.]|uniref:OmpW/AlkL family protein n=1 Tax=Halomonas sp. TaxID=1486246 RepID=UPI0025C509E9|nr:OmpW family outer membrane protein [Halomonas sp.]
MRISPFVAAAALSLSTVAGQALAYQAGDLYVRGEFQKSDLASETLSRESGFGLAGGYLFTDALGVELGIGEAVSHDFQLDAGDAGSLDRMPVNLLLQYYPLGGIEGARVQPFVGVGMNYTRFSSVSAADLSVDDDYGFAGQVGMDLVITDNLSATSFARYTEVDASFESDGQTVENVRLDPLTVGAGITYRF